MAIQDRLGHISRPFQFIWLSIKLHFLALEDAIRTQGLTSLIHPQRIRDAAAAKLFIATSAGFIAYENTTCVPALVRSSRGKILELGPGPGNQVHRYDPSLVEFIYAVDPNLLFGDNIAAKVKALDLQDKYKLLACGIEDSETLRKEGITEGSMDTVLSIQVLCAVADVKSVMREVWKLLKPGGSFIFWEHVESKDTITSMTQAFWNPAWGAFIGCCLNRHLLEDILAAGEWQNPEDITVSQDSYDLLPRISGVLRKKA